MVKAFGLGILASLFFAVTFVLNRQMQLAGGHWIWSASLRYFFMLPLLFALLVPRRRFRPVLGEIRRRPAAWLGWSTVGFGLFYALVCYGSASGPAWAVAATWQLTIVCGVLLTPLIRQPGAAVPRQAIPKRQLLVSALILAGVVLAQARGLREPMGAAELGGILAIVLAAFAYPLGNRAMMAIMPERIGTLERVFGMTLCSLPFWLVLSAAAVGMGRFPSGQQVIQSFIVALFSGVIATVLFFKATETVRGDSRRLAVVESTQAGEVVFALLGGALIFGDALPSPLAWAGLAVIITGLVLNGFLAGRAAPGAAAPRA